MGLSELELSNQRHEELRREAENWRRMAGLDRATALWGRTSVLFFRAQRIADAESEERSGHDER